MKSISSFNFSPEQLEDLRASIRAYFLDELETEIGNLQLDLFIDYLNEHVGKQYYNLGVSDTIQALKDKTDDLVMLVKE